MSLNARLDHTSLLKIFIAASYCCRSVLFGTCDRCCYRRGCIVSFQTSFHSSNRLSQVSVITKIVFPSGCLRF